MTKKVKPQAAKIETSKVDESTTSQTKESDKDSDTAMDSKKRHTEAD